MCANKLAFLLLLSLVRHSAQDFLQQLTRDYDRNIRPHNALRQVNITIQIELVSVSSLDEHTFTYAIDCYQRFWWNDERFVFPKNATLDQIEFNTDPEKLIWIPSVVMRNSKETKIGKNQRTIIKANGDVYLSRRLKVVLNCKMDLWRYPMDTQTCPLVMEDYTFGSKDLQLLWNEVPYLLPSDEVLEIPGYDFERMNALKRIHIYRVGVTELLYDRAYLHLTASRTFTYFLYRVYIPSILLMVFNMASYWVPDGAVPARVGLIVTTFLTNTFILQSVTEQTVKVPYTTSLQIFLLGNVVLLVISIIEYLIVLFLKSKVGDEDALGSKSSLFIKKMVCSRESSSTHVVDHVCRLFIPFAYSIFVLTYFLYFFNAQ